MKTKDKLQVSFDVEYQESDGLIVGNLIAFPGICTQAKTLEEFGKNIMDCLVLALEPFKGQR